VGLERRTGCFPFDRHPRPHGAAACKCSTSASCAWTGSIPGGTRRLSRALACGWMAAAEPTTGGLSMPSTVTAGRAQTMGVALQRGDDAGEQERQPHGGARDRAGLPQQGEDARSHHRADPEERGPRTVIDRFAAPTSAAPAVPSITAVSSAFRVAEQRGCHPNRPAERSSPDADEISNFTRHG